MVRENFALARELFIVVIFSDNDTYSFKFSFCIVATMQQMCLEAFCCIIMTFG